MASLQRLLRTAERQGRRALSLLSARREQLLARLFTLYVRNLQTDRTLDEGGFQEHWGRHLDQLCQTLLAADLRGLDDGVRSLGAELSDRGVPFSEMAAVVHLLEQILREHLEAHSTGSADELLLALNQVIRRQVSLLAHICFAPLPLAAATVEHSRSKSLGRPGSQGRSADCRLSGRRLGLIGDSPAMQQARHQIEVAAGGRGAVLIMGESGTGKELAARALHQCGSDADQPLVVVNCAAVPNELVESELFGYSKGAYTGAQQASRGLVRAAAGGTLFLDEVTEMPLGVQAKLLRVLEQGAVRPVGGSEEVFVKVRFVASTNRDPKVAVRSGVLREDIYHRLNVHRVEMPPLRERTEDLALLVAHFCQHFAREGLPRAEGIDDEALALLRQYPWPGNVRELRNAVEAALALGQEPLIRHWDLPSYIRNYRGAPSCELTADPTDVPTFAQAERQLLERALAATGGNKLQAAKLLGISRNCLYDKIRKYKIRPTLCRCTGEAQGALAACAAG